MTAEGGSMVDDAAQSVGRDTQAGRAGPVAVDDPDRFQWDLVARSRRSSLYAIGVAIFLVVVFTVLGSLLRVADTGVHFRIWDQISIALIGVLMGCGVLLFTRPRLRVGPQGISVRNLFSDKFIQWDLVQRITFPEGASWARIDLPDDEYVPVLAVQINDRGRSVEAVKRFRALQRLYAGGQGREAAGGQD